MSLQPKQRYQRWELSYRIPGYKKVFFESFGSYNDARVRCAEIELEKALGTLRPPEVDKKKAYTVREYLNEYMTSYGATHWGDSQYSVCRRMFNNYVGNAPLADLLLRQVKTKDIDAFYEYLLAERS